TCAVNKRETIFHTEFFRGAATVFTASEHRVRFIDKNTRAMRLCDIKQRPRIPEIAIHGINSFHHYELAASLFARQRLIERYRVVVLEFVCPTSRKRRAVAQT